MKEDLKILVMMTNALEMISDHVMRLDLEMMLTEKDQDHLDQERIDTQRVGDIEMTNHPEIGMKDLTKKIRMLRKKKKSQNHQQHLSNHLVL